MKALMLMLALLLLGTGAGAGAAWLGGWLGAGDPAPADEASEAPVDNTDMVSDAAPAGTGVPVSSAIRPDAEYQRLDDPFLVPLVRDNAVAAMMVLTLGLEVAPGQTAVIHAREPRLRNQLLQALFDHANTGGFEGMFTGAANMRALREGLTRAARDVVGEAVGSVLILDMVRQEG